MGIDALRHNLLNMKNKLEGYLQMITLAPVVPLNSKIINYINNNTNNNINENSNTNISEVKIDFKETKKISLIWSH